MLGDYARERDGEVVAQSEVGLPGRLVLAALQDLEDELIALVAVLADQRLEVLDRGRLERLEAVALEDLADDADDVRHAGGRRRAGSRACRAQVRGRHTCRGPQSGLTARHRVNAGSHIVDAVAHVALGVLED